PPTPTLFPYTTLFRSPTSRPASRQPSRQVSPTLSAENSAQGNRTLHSETPPVRRATVTPAQWSKGGLDGMVSPLRRGRIQLPARSEEHTSELQSRGHL